MDLIKTLLIYMIMVISGAVQSAPAVTPPVPNTSPEAIGYTVTMPPVQAPTLTPSPSPSPTPIRYTTLYVGDRGDAVRTMQRRLTELGYLNDTIDGVYGKNTKAAVERFQYYNNLQVDGIAGPKTLAMLYESTAVVTAPPNITKNPTKKPTATPAPAVNVPVYYVNESGTLLYSMMMTCYGNTTIYANGNYVGANYELISSGSVSVTVRNGVATPASVTFRYRARATSEPVQDVVVPIYYQDVKTGELLYSTLTAPLAPGRTHYITASLNLVPAGYSLLGTDTVAVTVSASGVASPQSVIFSFMKKEDTPDVKYASVAVQYQTENGAVLHTEMVHIPRDAYTAVYANSQLIPEGYTLISANPINVHADQDGVCNPGSVTFTYRAPEVTSEPKVTETPEPEVTETPVPEVTETPVPEVTETPAPEATDTPEPEVTETPEPVVTETPVPEVTETPAPEATDTPEPEVTETPEPEVTETPVPEVTETPEPVATDTPEPEPTETPVPEATDTPEPEPTETPEPVATDTPEPEPTETPKPTEKPAVLVDGGDTVNINGQSSSLKWMKDGSGNPMVSLKKLAGAANWSYSAGGTSDINGHSVNVQFDGGGIGVLSVDGTSYKSSAVVYEGDLYVGLSFLRALGYDASASGSTITLTSNE